MAADSDGGDIELSEPLMWSDRRKPERSAEKIIKQINSKNAKLVAFGLIIGFILYHGVIHLRFGKLSF